jgi:threonine/homoserine/homoserine lactone efflux protein
VGEINPLLAFTLTALIIEITPGPNMTYLAALSLSNDIRTGYAAVAGIALGLMTYGVIAALGLAALIDNSPLLYDLLRWSGVVYLLWLAWENWASERDTTPETVDGKDGRPWLAFRQGLITNLLNPKAAVFYVAVLPEFIQVDGGPVVLQTLVLSVIYVAIATSIHSAIVALAGTLQATVVTGRRRIIRRGLALALVGIAIWFALTTGRAR